MVHSRRTTMCHISVVTSPCVTSLVMLKRMCVSVMRCWFCRPDLTSDGISSTALGWWLVVHGCMIHGFIRIVRDVMQLQCMLVLAVIGVLDTHLHHSRQAATVTGTSGRPAVWSDGRQPCNQNTSHGTLTVVTMRYVVNPFPRSFQYRAKSQHHIFGFAPPFTSFEKHCTLSP